VSGLRPRPGLGRRCERGRLLGLVLGLLGHFIEPRPAGAAPAADEQFETKKVSSIGNQKGSIFERVVENPTEKETQALVTSRSSKAWWDI